MAYPHPYPGFCSGLCEISSPQNAGTALRGGVQLVVSLCDGGLNTPHQRGEVVAVGQFGGFNRLKHSHLRVTAEEQLRPWPRNPIGAFDDDGKNRELGVDRNPERPLLEGEQVVSAASRPFGEDNQGVPTFSSQLDTLVDNRTARTASLSIDRDNSHSSHRPSDDRNPEQFLLREEPALDREYPQHQWDVERRKVIRDNHVARLRIDVFETLDFERHRGHTQERARPALHDAAVERRCRSHHAVRDDEQRIHNGEQEQQRDENERSDAGNQGVSHAGSVDEMEQVT